MDVEKQNVAYYLTHGIFHGATTPRTRDLFRAWRFLGGEIFLIRIDDHKVFLQVTTHVHHKLSYYLVRR